MSFRARFFSRDELLSVLVRAYDLLAVRSQRAGVDRSRQGQHTCARDSRLSNALRWFEARGRTLPRKRPAPHVTEIHAGSIVEVGGWRVTVGRAQHVQPYLECLAFRLDTKEGRIKARGAQAGPNLGDGV